MFNKSKKEKDNTEKKKINSKSRIFRVIIWNIIAIGMISHVSANYLKDKKALYLEEEKKNFAAVVISMEKMAYANLRNHQVSCNDRVQYLKRNPMTIADALDLFNDSCSEDTVMLHLIDVDTLKGYSSVPDINGNNEIDYTAFPDLTYETLGKKDFEGRIFISKTFTNPINGQSVVGFGGMVPILSEDGTGHKYYALLKVVNTDAIKGILLFPKEYSEAKLSLINGSGDYLISSDSTGEDNFWTQIQNNNNLSDEESDALKEIMTSEPVPVLLKNKRGESVYYLCSAHENESDWKFVVSIPESGLSSGQTDWGIIFILLGSFLTLVAINGGYIAQVHRTLIKNSIETEKANQAKTDFLSSMSHDIRTPMNAISGMLSIAVKNLDDRDKVEDCLNKITLATTHLQILINDVLDISKVESGKMSLNPTRFSLADELANIINIERPEIESKGIKLDVKLHNIINENIYADETRMNQIAMNLFSNAVKYTNQGGSITVVLSQEKIPDTPNMVDMTLVVSDTGIGMDEEFQKKMYVAFSRAEDTRIDKIQGSGLGLAITKQMVDLLGGTIECESEPGKGTTFIVKLQVQTYDRDEELSFDNKRVLIVDDDTDLILNVPECLSSEKIIAEGAGGGKNALKLISFMHDQLNVNYDAIFIDLRMPEMNGIETARRIKALLGEKCGKLIISGFDWGQVEDEAREVGVDGFVTKPIFKSTLNKKMKELFSEDTCEPNQSEQLQSKYSGIRLLVAEDNEMNWIIVEEILGEYGIQTERAGNGAICVNMLERTEENRYDAILMDVQMPIMNGRDATRKIRTLSNPEKRNIPIIAMTADAFTEDMNACFEAGMNAHISKPVDYGKLFAAFDKLGIGKK